MRLIEPLSEEQRGILLPMVEQSSIECRADPYYSGDTTFWLVEDEQEIVGFVATHSVDWKSRRCRGLIWIEPEWRRKGVARKVVVLHDSMMFDQWNMNRLEWAVSASNANAVRFFKKHGLGQQEGRLEQAAYYDGAYHDILLFAITKAKWESLKRDAGRIISAGG